MTDKEKIRAEIERRLEELNPKKGELMGRPLRDVNPKTFPRERELEKLLSIINSLPEEPVSEDLGEYISELSKQFPEVSFAKLSRIAVRVANWQKQQMMTKAVEVPIEEAVPFGSCKWKLCAKLWLDKGVKGNKVKVIIIKED